MKKILTGILLAAVLLTASTGVVFAQEPAPITGTIQSIELQTDPGTGETIAAVTLLDSTGAAQTVLLSLETAEALGLVTTDPATGETTVNEDALNTEITIDPSQVLPEPPTEEPEKEHPVGSALGDFFSELLGVDYETIMEYHENGFGFGVIAQALWLTNQIDGDTSTFTALLDAKQSGDYSGITLADGSTPDNWGDVVKSLKKGENLGSVMSGRADNSAGEPAALQKEKENGNGNNGQGNGQGNNGNQGNGQENREKGKDKDDDKGKNKP